MTNLGVFRDDFYNAVHILTHAQQTAFTTQQTGTTLLASVMCGAADCYATYSGFAVAQSQTTDTAVNIIAQLSNAVNAAYKANVGGFASSLGAQPAISGIPNLFNMTWTFSIINQETAAGALTLTQGTGVTLATNGTASATVIAVATTAVYVATVTSATTVTFTRVQ